MVKISLLSEFILNIHIFLEACVTELRYFWLQWYWHCAFWWLKSTMYETLRKMLSRSNKINLSYHVSRSWLSSVKFNFVASNSPLILHVIQYRLLHSNKEHSALHSDAHRIKETKENRSTSTANSPSYFYEIPSDGRTQGKKGKKNQYCAAIA